MKTHTHTPGPLNPVLQTLLSESVQFKRERDDLWAQNAALLAALEQCIAVICEPMAPHVQIESALADARAAIALARGNSSPSPSADPREDEISWLKDANRELRRDIAGMSEDEREELSHLGNAGEPANLTHAWIAPVQFKAERDLDLMLKLAEARGAAADNLSEV